ncbi:MAG TPA: hypothetical protein VGO50_09875 [Pyrinomonadaceae bacterium]|jgi:hypothetical protein|nr:hypothetical protein [Pyrinomonadaceae bacterium]
MHYPNLFKRIVPFALALALGLFVASFFVTLTPSFRGKGRGFRSMKTEFRDLKLENERLKAEIDELKQRELNCKEWDFKKFDLEKEDWGDTFEAAPSMPKHLEKKLKEKLERLEKNR